MDKSKYKEIRNKKDFLYLYFVSEGGRGVPESLFNQLFPMWVRVFSGTDEIQGIAKIVKWLDEKHN